MSEYCKTCGRKLNQNHICGFYNKPMCPYCNGCELCYVAPRKKQAPILNNPYEEGQLRYFIPDPNEV